MALVIGQIAGAYFGGEEIIHPRREGGEGAVELQRFQGGRSCEGARIAVGRYAHHRGGQIQLRHVELILEGIVADNVQTGAGGQIQRPLQADARAEVRLPEGLPLRLGIEAAVVVQHKGAAADGLESGQLREGEAVQTRAEGKGLVADQRDGLGLGEAHGLQRWAELETIGRNLRQVLVEEVDLLQIGALLGVRDGAVDVQGLDKGVPVLFRFRQVHSVAGAQGGSDGIGGGGALRAVVEDRKERVEVAGARLPVQGQKGGRVREDAAGGGADVCRNRDLREAGIGEAAEVEIAHGAVLVRHRIRRQGGAALKGGGADVLHWT